MISNSTFGPKWKKYSTFLLKSTTRTSIKNESKPLRIRRAKDRRKRRRRSFRRKRERRRRSYQDSHNVVEIRQKQKNTRVILHSIRLFRANFEDFTRATRRRRIEKNKTTQKHAHSLPKTPDKNTRDWTSNFWRDSVFLAHAFYERVNRCSVFVTVGRKNTYGGSKKNVASDLRKHTKSVGTDNMQNIEKWKQILVRCGKSGISLRKSILSEKRSEQKRFDF